MSFFLVSQLSSPVRMEEGVPGHMCKNKTKLNILKLSSGQIILSGEFFVCFWSRSVPSYNFIFRSISQSKGKVALKQRVKYLRQVIKDEY